MNKEEIIAMAKAAGFCASTETTKEVLFWRASAVQIERFAALVAAAKDAEHKEAMRWDIHSCGPTCKRYACVATREAVLAEREACLKLVFNTPPQDEYECPLVAVYKAIRARNT